MRRIDELHLLYPFASSRMLRDLLRQEGRSVESDLSSFEHVEIGDGAQYLSLSSTQARGDPTEPALADHITYVLMPLGFVYLVAFVYWYTRRVQAWRVSHSASKRWKNR